ncbi:MAG: hypothetical protein A3F67_01855 [Verrucomicrobia bacterium RIFCSPHIGHO2_12_FULL_41_10]|nr:MAG: hypothetical protein A3F67_01855 [Verrucomicrobia bacterium RIFCSPHIGHO2_12_FULL_41_10]HLB33190.1 DUF4381 family protein [Chthoniobacterales bacterium]
MPQPTPAPLHDIVGPLPFFPYTPWQVGIVVGIFILLLGAIVWVIWKLCQKPPLTPREATMKALASMKKELMKGNDHDFGMFVSRLLRYYLSEVFALAAPRQTTEEFLASLRESTRFTPTEQESLGIFLKQSDLLKFAGGKASEQERLALITAAEDFVRGEGPEG